MSNSIPGTGYKIGYSGKIFKALFSIFDLNRENLNLPGITFLKLTVFLVLMLAFSSGLSAQSGFANNWINKEQRYFKIPVAENGIYRLDYQLLANAGFPVDQVDPRRLQIFHRGNEQAIFINGQEDAVFNQGDYILFYGRRNDGTLDRELYNPPDAQPHDYYNLYSDTTAYFLTWQLGAGNGKRMGEFSENNVNNIPAESAYLEERLQLFTNNYSPGRQYPQGAGIDTYLSYFDYGEGWTGPVIKKGQSRDFNLETTLEVSGQNAPRLEILLAGRNNRPHQVNIKIGPNTSILTNLTTVNFDYRNNYLVNENLDIADIQSDNLVVRVTAQGDGSGGSDNVSVSYINLIYPRQVDMGGLPQKKFRLQQNSGGKSYLEIENVPQDPFLIDITNQNNPRIIGHNYSNGLLNTVVPSTDVQREIFVDTETMEPAIREINFKPDGFSDAEYLIITHRDLMQQGGGYSNPVDAYAQYRRSSRGGGYNVEIFEINRLYDQFNYGEVSPMAIRNLAQFLIANGNPKFLFLVGKSLTVNYNYYRDPGSGDEPRDLVPTGGYPGSDVVMTSGLGGSENYEAAIPTGRLNARAPAEVAAYLDKVKEDESNENAGLPGNNTREALWEKNLVHLSGGVTSNQLILFKSFVNDLKDIAENPYLGGQVTTLSKETNNSVELINVADQVNKGVNMITFFGHSSGTVTDIEIGYVTNDQLGYDNKGKYPLIYLNGCNAGNIFSNTLTFGENWILTPDKGALNVIAHSGIGLSNILKYHVDIFYEYAFGDSLHIGSPIGKIKQLTSRKFIQEGVKSSPEIAQVQQMVIQGDPAATIFGKRRTDYETNGDNISLRSFERENVTALADSFALDIIVRNFGKTDADSMAISVQRTLANGEIINYDTIYYPPVYYADTLTYVIRQNKGRNPDELFGNNQLQINLDPVENVDELRENNNQGYFEAFLPLGGTVNLLPYNFYINTTDTLTLQAQSGDLLNSIEKGNSRDFLFQIDTSSGFDSPVLMTTTINALTLARWDLTLPVKEDSTVYYWRTKFTNPLPGEDDSWDNSSFVLLNNSTKGWWQSTYEQYRQNSLNGLQQKGDSDILEFKTTSSSVELITSGADYSGGKNPSLLINDIQFLLNSPENRKCRTNSINGIAFAKDNLSPYLAVDRGGYDVLDGNSCGRRPQTINTFNDSQITGADLMLEKYVDNVNTGDPVIIFSLGELQYSTWPSSTRNKLMEIGASANVIDSLTDGEPLIILGEKGADPGTAIQISADPAAAGPLREQVIDLDHKIEGKFGRGTVETPPIGPASDWSQVNVLMKDWQVSSDNIKIEISGINKNGQEQLLMTRNSNLRNIDLQSIDPVRYPYVNLKFTLEDKVNYTAPELNKWWVNYEGVPEGIIHLEDADSMQVKKQEGEQFATRFSFQNISNTRFNDSIAVLYNIFNEDTRSSEKDTLFIKPLQSNEKSLFDIPINTLGKAGKNDLIVSVNPEIQPEQNYNNNNLSIDGHFDVRVDKSNPVVDVAFDGRYIMDGEIVSPQPVITIEIRDENQFLPLKDTTGVSVYLKKKTDEQSGTSSNARTSANGFKKINFANSNVEWTPAEKNKPFKVHFQPESLTDGTHTLRVQAEDASGNKAGSEPYEIDFEIVNESSISNFYPYPNPFSTSTRFVFTLTGTKIPENFKIQIMTISGKVVREITKPELGEIHIGQNITDFAWNGTDEFGDKLANGVYLYRVVMGDSFKDVEHRKTKGDKAFKKGFGKLYILR